MKKGKIFILSGPSGSGKTTLYKKILQHKSFRNKLAKTVSITTRPKRTGEVHGRDYFFVSRKMFLYKKQAGHFLESQKVFDNYYGTPNKQVQQLLKQGKNVLLCIDVKGAMVVCRKIPQAVKIFVNTPSLNELKRRLESRASESKSIINLRLATAREEIAQSKNYDHIVINDHIASAFKKLKDIVEFEIAN